MNQLESFVDADGYSFQVVTETKCSNIDIYHKQSLEIVATHELMWLNRLLLIIVTQLV